jgi:hypothetical protein
MAMTTSWMITWITGPDAGASCRLGPGEHLVGRAPQVTVRCDDRALEPFHARLTLAATVDGGWQIHQLAGRTPVECSGVEVRLGRSTLRIDPVALDPVVPDPVAPDPAALDPIALDPIALDPVVLDPVAPDPAALDPIALDPVVLDPVAPDPAALDPAALDPVALDPIALDPVVLDPAALDPVVLDPAAAEWIGIRRLVARASTAALGVAIAVVVAVAARRLLVGALAASCLLVAGAAAAMQWRRNRRHRAATDARHADVVARWSAARAVERDAWAAHQQARCGTLPAALAALGADPARIWQRRLHHGDATVVTLGVGALWWRPAVTHRIAALAVDAGDDAELVSGVPVAVDLAPGAVVVLRGPHAAGLARSLIVQLACRVGSADWALELDVDDTARGDTARDDTVRGDTVRGDTVRGDTVRDDTVRGDTARDDTAAGGTAMNGSAEARATGAETATSRTVDEWAWTAALPHRTQQGCSSTAPHTVVLTERVDGLALASSPLRRSLAGPRPPAVLVVDSVGGPVPAVSTSVIDTTVDGRARARLDLDANGPPVELRLAALGPRGAARAAAALACAAAALADAPAAHVGAAPTVAQAPAALTVAQAPTLATAHATATVAHATATLAHAATPRGVS